MRKQRRVYDNNRERIIACDDATGILDGLRIKLMRKGFSFEGTTDPKELIEKLKNKNYDILILDYFLEKINAENILPLIREVRPDIYIILLTGHSKLLPSDKMLDILDVEDYCEKDSSYVKIMLAVESAVKAKKRFQIAMKHKPKMLMIGEKIKITRSELNMSQKELAGEERSGNLISLIESGKVNLSKDMAIKIAEKFNKKIIDNKIKRDLIDPEWLLEDMDIQLDKIFRKYSDEFNSIKESTDFTEKIDEKIQEVEMFLKYNSTNINYKFKLKIYEFIAIFLQENYNFGKCYTYNLKSLNTAYELEDMDYIKIIEIYLRFVQIYLAEGKYEETVLIGNVALKIAEDENIANDCCNKIRYNIANAYSYLMEYEECLYQLGFLDADFLESKYVQVLVYSLQASCYFELGDLPSSKKLYMDILPDAKLLGDLYMEELICGNLAEIFLELNQKEIGRAYLERLNEINFEGDEQSSATRIFNNIKFNLLYDNVDYINENYIKALALIANSSNKHVRVDFINIIINYFIEKKDIVRVRTFLNCLETLILVGNKFKHYESSSAFFKSMQLFEGIESQKIYNTGIDILRYIEKNNRL